MPRCSGCSGDRCSCVIQAGENVTITGAGTYVDPFIVTAVAGEGGSGDGWTAGDVKMTARSSAPAGWLVANGAAVSRSSYADLFAAIGVAFGPGDGSTTFNLPDLAGRFPLGADGSHPLGAVGGAETTTISVAQMPAHNHNGVTGGGGSHSHSGTTATAGYHTHSYLDFWYNTIVTVDARGAGGVPTIGSINEAIASASRVTDGSGDHAHNLNVNAVGDHTHAVASQGGGEAVPIMPPWTGVSYIIKT